MVTCQSLGSPSNSESPKRIVGPMDLGYAKQKKGVHRGLASDASSDD
jgi:hypothetical protein